MVNSFVLRFCVPGVVGVAFAIGAVPAYAECKSIDSLLAVYRAPANPQLQNQQSTSDGLSRISRQQLEMLVQVRARLAAVALSNPAVGVCESDVINAVAIGAGPNIPPSGLVLITTAMMEVIGTDEVRAASLLAHEIAHIIEQHGQRRARFSRVAARQANEVGAQEEARRIGAGTIAARQVFAAATAAYSREIERRADEVGYQIFQAAGFDPRGATRLFEVIRDREGERAATYLDSHPGLDERIARLLVLAQNDSVRAQAAENSKAIAQENEKYRPVADELLRSGRWRALSSLVSTWLGALPQSGLAWYYRGLLMQKSKKDKSRAWGAFAKGVEFDPERPEIWQALIAGLLEGGYRNEAAACVAMMSYVGHSTREVRTQHFDEKLFVHGYPRTTPANLVWARERNGQRFITNDPTLLAPRGLRGEAIPPPWLPAR
jgi:Zn-dependent protease with chaperone function